MSTDAPLPERRKGYAQMEENLQTHAEEIEEQLRRFIRNAMIAFAIVGLCCAAGILGFGLVLREQGHQQDQIKSLAVKNHQITTEIQKQRATTVRENCEAVNKRHDTTIKLLIAAAKLEEKNSPTEEAKQAVRQRRMNDTTFIDSILPTQDCEKLVRIALGKETP